MKKVILSLAVVAMGFSFTSCKKCGKCVYESGVDGMEFCQKDSKVLYDAAKDACNSTPGAKWE